MIETQNLKPLQVLLPLHFHKQEVTGSQYLMEVELSFTYREGKL